MAQSALQVAQQQARRVGDVTAGRAALAEQHVMVGVAGRRVRIVREGGFLCGSNGIWYCR